MSVHPSRRRGPLPHDLEFAALDGASAGWSHLDAVAVAPPPRGSTNAKGKGKAREGDVEIVPSVRMNVVEGLDGVRFPPPPPAFARSHGRAPRSDT